MTVTCSRTHSSLVDQYMTVRYQISLTLSYAKDEKRKG